MTNKKLEDRIARLRQLRSAPSDKEVVQLIRKALSDRSNLVVAEAARAAAELRLSSLIPDLLDAFGRLFEDPIKTDPKCWGKAAIVKALVLLEYSESAPFVRGSRHVQMEPVWGGHEDAAPHFRANCYLALVQASDLTRFNLLSSLVDAMTDPADPVRVEAVRALHQLGGDDATLLLRLKARIGDQRPLILGHVFDALLSLEQDRSVPFVAEYLNSANSAVRDEAALALGSSRLAAAFERLIAIWKEAASESFAGVLLRAISSSRRTEAIEFLLDLVETGSSRQAKAASEALEIHKDSPEILSRLKEARKGR